MKVTLLISRSVVTPKRTFSSADSRKNTMPSCRAVRRISELGRRARIISRTVSVSSRSSWMAVRPRKPVPAQSRQPAPSKKSRVSHSPFSPEASSVSRG